MWVSFPFPVNSYQTPRASDTPPQSSLNKVKSDLAPDVVPLLAYGIISVEMTVASSQPSLVGMPYSDTVNS